jgi:chemotaxis protein methyltransferase CheR
VTPGDLEFLEALAKARCGLGLRGDKAYFAESRLAALARREGLESTADLLTRLREGDDERLAGLAGEALAVTDTAFFRDGDTFEALRSVIAELAGPAGDRPVQIWSAGCSTGQEPYSIAMMGEQMTPAPRLEIVATDLSERVLEKAHAGLYTQFEVQRGLPIRLLLQHFQKAGEMWEIAPRLRAAVRWRRLNLIEPRRSVRRFDVILCRNVLSYFEDEVRERVLGQIIASLAPGGVLALGHGEAPPPGLSPLGASVFRLGAASQAAAA